MSFDENDREIFMDFQPLEQVEDYGDYNYCQQYNNNQFATEIPRHVTQVTIERFLSLENQEFNTKNIPKTFGNNFKKFLENLQQQLKQMNKDLPERLLTFVSQKQSGKQSNYTIADFKAFFGCELSNHYFQFYMKNQAFLDLTYSNRIRNPEEHIKFIEQYFAGANDKENFISNRPIGQLKSQKKDDKGNNRVSQLIDQQNLQNIGDQTDFNLELEQDIQQPGLLRKSSYNNDENDIDDY